MLHLTAKQVVDETATKLTKKTEEAPEQRYHCRYSLVMILYSCSHQRKQKASLGPKVFMTKAAKIEHMYTTIELLIFLSENKLLLALWCKTEK